MKTPRTTTGRCVKSVLCWNDWPLTLETDAKCDGMTELNGGCALRGLFFFRFFFSSKL